MTVTTLPPKLVLPDAGLLGEGQGKRFSVLVERYRGLLHGYLNTCRHQFMNLDFEDGHFFDDDYDALVCCHHGARYRPETGECFEGPCEGASLTRLVLEERGRELWCTGVERGPIP
jgi:nitrite reductase/ring-hydroxylating ferredoxin subunit